MRVKKEGEDKARKRWVVKKEEEEKMKVRHTEREKGGDYFRLQLTRLSLDTVQYQYNVISRYTQSKVFLISF